MKSKDDLETLISILNNNAERSPDHTIYTFPAENKEPACVTNQELLQGVIESASRLLTITQGTSRAILLLAPGLNYPLSQNMHSILMAPTIFLKCPFFWLKIISDYKVQVYVMTLKQLIENPEIKCRDLVIALPGDKYE